MKRFRLAAAMSVVLAVGCATAASSRSSTPLPSKIVFTQVGGIAGIADRLTVDSDGHAVLSRRTGIKTTTWKRTLSAVTLARILRLVDQAYAHQLRPNYTFSGTVADGIDMTVTYRGKTVKIEMLATPPSELSKALEALSKLAWSFPPRS